MDLHTFASDEYGVQYLSPQFSRDVNLALSTLPSGIVRGFIPQTAASAFLLNLQPDPVHADHLARVRTATGETLAVRYKDSSPSDKIQVNLAAAVGTTVVVGVQVAFAPPALTTAKVVALTLVEYAALTGGFVAICQVAVPGSGPITAAQITPLYRKSAFSEVGAGERWSPLIQNPGFEQQVGALGVTVRRRMPGWWSAKLDGTAHSVWALSAVADLRTGHWALGTSVTGAVAEDLRIAAGEDGVGRDLFPVSPGQWLMATAGVRCVTSGTNVVAGLLVRYWDIVGTTELSSETIAFPLIASSAFEEVASVIRAPATTNGDAADCYFVTVELKFNATSGVSNAGQWYVDTAQVWAQAFTGLEPRTEVYTSIRAQAIVLGNPAGTDELIIKSSGTGALIRSRLQSADRVLQIGEASSNKRIDLNLNGTLTVEEAISAASAAITTITATTITAPTARFATVAQATELKLKQLSHGVNGESSVQLVDDASSATPTADYVTWRRVLNGYALNSTLYSANLGSGGYGPYVQTGAGPMFVMIDLDTLLDSGCSTDTPYSTLDSIVITVVPQSGAYTGGTNLVTVRSYRVAFVSGVPTSAPVVTDAADVANFTGTDANAANPNPTAFTMTLATPQQINGGASTAGTKAFIAITLASDAPRNGVQLSAIELSGKTYRIAPN